MRQRKYVIALLFVLAIALSGITYAYWASGISVTQAGDVTNTINIGEGATVTTTVAVTNSASSTLDLVPVGREVTDVSVSSITYTFNVAWAGASDATSAANATADLTVTPTLSGAAEPELALFTVTSSHSSATNVIYGSTTTVTITVEFTHEPANATQYTLIADKELTLTVAFALGTVTPA